VTFHVLNENEKNKKNDENTIKWCARWDEMRVEMRIEYDSNVTREARVCWYFFVCFINSYCI
jgi:hypothetical protein